MTDLDRTARTVIGLFRDRGHAEEAIRDLRASGFPDDRIGLAMQDASEARSPGAMTERRRVPDPSYSGPERRLIGV